MWGVDDLVVAYGRRRVVSGVTFSLQRGKITAVVGGDGAGKTTVLRALVGAVAPAGGRVIAPPAEEIGYVSEGGGLYLDLSVEENLRFSGRAYGMPPDVLDQRTNELLDRTQLQQARGRLGGKLSGGMRRKLALAMAMLHDPPLLVLDEPTTGLDPVSRAELWRLIAGAAARGAAVVMATSYIDEAERAEEVVILVDGSVLMSGPPEQIVRSAAGSLFTFRHRPEAWRRGAAWRVWSEDRLDLEQSVIKDHDLEDAVVIGELMRKRALPDHREAS